MAGRKRTRNWRRGRRVNLSDQQRSGSESERDDDLNPQENSKQLDIETIEHKILHAKHPFEKSRLIDSKSVTPSQRAITCCFQINGGWATEDTVLTFLQAHWGFIGKINSRLPNNLPDARILHINFAVKKKGIPLFIQHPENPDLWGLNTAGDPRPRSSKIKSVISTRIRKTDNTTQDSSAQSEEDISDGDNGSSPELSSREDFRNVDGKSKFFEDLILDLLKENKNGLTIEEIINLTKDIENVPGLFDQLPHPRRVRGCLIAKRSSKEVFFNDGKWSCFEHQEIFLPIERNFYPQSLPEPLKGIKFSDYTVEQLWNLLKENKIY